MKETGHYKYGNVVFGVTDIRAKKIHPATKME